MNKILSHLYIFLVALAIVVIGLATIFLTGKNTPTFSKIVREKIESPVAKPAIDVWIAWWDEKKAYDFVAKHGRKIRKASPVWYMVDENLTLKEAGEEDKILAASNLKAKKIEIYPSLGSEVGGKKLGQMLSDSKNVDLLIDDLVERLKELNVQGVDIDLESIEKKHKEDLNNFFIKLDKKLSENNLKMTVAAHAKHPDIFWEGNEGQDLELIGKLADEVRVMLYDEHYAGGEPGAISSYEWMGDVINHTLESVPSEKIVAGIPSYGYIWDAENSHGLQYYEFLERIKDKKHTIRRDEESGELVYEGNNFEGWLSDSKAMVSKVNYLRSLGINKFIIWHLGGMDDRFFDHPFVN